MDKQLAQLQATLREIERGAGLKRLDGVLVQRVLQKPVWQPQARASEERVSGQDAHQALLELLELRRKKKKKQQQSVQDVAHKNQQESVPVEPLKSVTTPLHRITTPVSDFTLEQQEALLSPPPDPFAVLKSSSIEDDVSDVRRNEKRMQHAVRARGQQLLRSQQQVEHAAAELQTLLAQSQSLLPSRFLFERNLTALCHERSLDVVKSVLRRFQHRFYELAFALWHAATLAQRHIAHTRAATTISRVFRGHCGRKLAQQVRQQLVERQRQAATLLTFRVAYRQHQALKIQMVWRRCRRQHAIAAREQRRKSATYLQQLFRDRRLRQNRLVHVLLHARAILAAVVVQSHFRGHYARRQLHAQRQQQARELVAAAVLARHISRKAQLQWQLDRQGASFLICSRAVYPFAVKRRRQSLLLQVQQQRAAQMIKRCVCRWFGVDLRRADAQARQLETWLRALASEQRRTCAAALVIQRQLRRWVTQRQFEMETTRRRKIARKQRIADKAARLHAGGSVTTKAPAVSSLSKKTSSPPKFSIALKGLRLLVSPNRSDKSAAASDGAAATIQRCFLRHRRYIQFLHRHWRDEAVNVEQRVLMRRRAATVIQTRVRGRLARYRCRQLKAEQRLRECIVAWKRKFNIRRTQVARTICHWLAQKRSQQLAHIWRLERQRRHAMATRIQQRWRNRYALRIALATLLARARRRDETALFCQQSLRVCTQHVTDDVVFASLHCSFEDGIRGYVYPLTNQVKSPNQRQRPHPQASSSLFFPILQLVFLIASGAKDPTKWRETDERTLLKTKLERSRVVALFKAVNKHHADAQSAAAAASKRSPMAKKSNAPFFSMTDVDVALAKAVGASKRALTFDEFGRVLRLLGELKLGPHVQVWWSRFEGSDAQLLALLCDFVFVLPEMAPLVHRLSDYVHRELNRRCECLQRLFQRKRNLRHGLLARLERRRQLDAAARNHAATLVQARVRVLLAKQQLKQRVQTVYEKYIDPDWGLPYWTNPTSGYATWAKPRVLRAEDVHTEAVPYPPASLTLKIACDGTADCVKCAEWFCHDCAEWFCVVCLPVFHEDAGDSDSVGDTTVSGKKKKSEHELEKIALCGLCQFQVASRKCVSCLPPRLTKNASLLVAAGDAVAAFAVSTTEREALYCDVCFAYAHRRGELTVHKSVELVEICRACTAGSNDDLDGKSTASNAKSPNREQGSKGQPPALGLAVQWQCERCESHPRVCGKCVATVHPPELCGAVAQRVPLQTLAMLERTRRLAAEADARDRADVAKMRLRALEARRERCALRLQRFWRARAPVLHAKRIVSQLQQQKRAHWLQLQADAKREKQFVYLVRSFFGVAKPLATDSVVHRKLREMNALQRRQLAHRARMFGLLVHEYMSVGIPLPGVGRVVGGGASTIDTTEDLRGWVKNRQTLRLKRVAVEPTGKRARPLETWSSWHHLSRWDRNHRDETVTDGDGDGNRDEELLVDVAAKEAITERRLPLAQPLALVEERKGDRDDAAEEQEEHVFVMYLVEYSMDPARVVWINHSLYVVLR